MRIVSS